MTDTPALAIIYEDEDLLVIDKPAGITVNRAETTKHEMTVQDWAEEKLKIEKGESQVDKESDFYKRSGIVHRIDKETSGVLLIAKNSEAFINLQQQFKDRVVKKTYIALVHGKMTPEAGEINVPVGRLPWNRKRFGIVPGGRESLTRYKVLKYYISSPYKTKTQEPMTLLALYPQSGRTHQIRVHLKYLNHPIFSDSLYAGRKTSRNDRKILPRVFLHAAEITFTHPRTDKTMTFASPLPQMLENVLQRFTVREAYKLYS